jgi:hypothetical protein
LLRDALSATSSANLFLCLLLRTFARGQSMDHYDYSVSDPIDPRFQASATVLHGELLLTIRTQLESGERAPALREADQFRRIVTHFARRFHSISVSWSYGDDLAAFNRAAAAGATPEEAALRTWTGQQAALAGFSCVQIRSLERQPGRYSKVAVSFCEPESSPPETKPK